MLKSIVCALALAATFPALAADGGSLASESRIVRYDDLNLASPAGMKRLERRIDAAARAVCGLGSAGPTAPSEFAKSRVCMTAAKAGAAKQVAALDIAQARGG